LSYLKRYRHLVQVPDDAERHEDTENQTYQDTQQGAASIVSITITLPPAPKRQERADRFAALGGLPRPAPGGDPDGFVVDQQSLGVVPAMEFRRQVSQVKRQRMGAQSAAAWRTVSGNICSTAQAKLAFADQGVRSAVAKSATWPAH